MKPMHASMFSLIGVVVAFLLSFSAFGADEASPVAKPEVKAGDRWTYRRTNYLTNAVSFTRADRVVSTGPDEILVVSKRSDQTGEFDVFFNSEWGAIVMGGTTLIPRADYFKFPLKIGATHNMSYETSQTGSPARRRYEFTVKVIGWEDLEVPAGKFRALKLEGNGSFVRIDPGSRFRGVARFRYWYVPEIRRWAKLTYEDDSRGDTTYVDELIQVSVQ